MSVTVGVSYEGFRNELKTDSLLSDISGYVEYVVRNIWGSLGMRKFWEPRKYNNEPKKKWVNIYDESRDLLPDDMPKKSNKISWSDWGNMPLLTESAMNDCLDSLRYSLGQNTVPWSEISRKSS
jgi:hypothetical protein